MKEDKHEGRIRIKQEKTNKQQKFQRRTQMNIRERNKNKNKTNICKIHKHKER